jgi:hypothetical protein
MIISTSNRHFNILIAIRARNAAPKILKIQTRQLFHGLVCMGRAAQHACVEHNQDKNERDLLRSIFGGHTRNPMEVFILNTHVGVPYALARSTVNLVTAFG